MYLWHLPLLLAMREAGLLPAALAPGTVVVVAVTLMVAATSWRVVERPLIDRARAKRPAGRRVPAARTPPTEAAG